MPHGILRLQGAARPSASAVSACWSSTVRWTVERCSRSLRMTGRELRLLRDDLMGQRKRAPRYFPGTPLCELQNFPAALQEARVSSSACRRGRRRANLCGAGDPGTQRSMGSAARSNTTAASCMRLRTARHEQRAAVGRILRRDLERAQTLGFGDDLQLVGADERTKDGQVNRRVSAADVVERLRAPGPRLSRHQRLPRARGVRSPQPP